MFSLIWYSMSVHFDLCLHVLYTFLTHCSFVLAGCEAKHNMRVFDVHLKQAEETAAALRLSTPPCACVKSLTLCVCVCFNSPPGYSVSVLLACSLAPLISPSAVTAWLKKHQMQQALRWVTHTHTLLSFDVVCEESAYIFCLL